MRAYRLKMLKLLKRWLGWDSGSGPFDFSDLRIGPNARPTQPAPASKPAPRTTTPQTPQSAQAQQPTQARGAHPQRQKKKELAPMDVLDNPSLTLDKPNDDGFDPYNTGAFNRSASWERIGRHKR
jgi:hypothetical protein